MVLLLQTLIADDVARDYCALEYPLNQVFKIRSTTSQSILLSDMKKFCFKYLTNYIDHQISFELLVFQGKFSQTDIETRLLVMLVIFQISVSPEVSCELTRVCLRQHDDEIDGESESSLNIDAVDTGLSDSVS